MVNISKKTLLISSILGLALGGAHVKATQEAHDKDLEEVTVVAKDLKQEIEAIDSTRVDIEKVLGPYTNQSNLAYLDEEMHEKTQAVQNRSEWVTEDNFRHNILAFPYIGRKPFFQTDIPWTTQNLQTQNFVTIYITHDNAMSITYPAESVKDFILQAFPQGWNNQIAQFSQNPEHKKMFSEYGIDSESEAITTPTKKEGKDVSITITSQEIPINTDQRAVMETLRHEICHANDWENAQSVKSSERFEILKRLLERISAGNRFHSRYVEGIQIVDGDEPKYYFRKVSEYWAEICSQWFEDKGELPLEDFTIVQDWIDEFESGYNPAQYQAAQEQFLSSGTVNSLEAVTAHLSEDEKKSMELKIESHKNLIQLMRKLDQVLAEKKALEREKEK